MTSTTHRDVSLEEANMLAAASAILPVHTITTTSVYMPLLRSCPVYAFVRSHFKVEKVILCFAATYMQRYIVRMHPTFDEWFSDRGFAAIMPPRRADDVELLLRYLACISLAYKHFADISQEYSLIEAAKLFVFRFLDNATCFTLEMEVMEVLNFRLNHQTYDPTT